MIEKEIGYMSKGKAMIILLIAVLMKKALCKIISYNRFGGNVKVELDLAINPTKTDLKGATGIDTLNLGLKSNWAKLKAEIDKIEVDKLKTAAVDFSKLSIIVNNEVVKKTVCDKLVAKLNAIDTSGIVLKTKYDTDKSDLEKKISDISRLVKKTDYNAKISEIEGRIPSITGLATFAALTTVKNKIPNVSNLVRESRLWCRNIRH